MNTDFEPHPQRLAEALARLISLWHGAHGFETLGRRGLAVTKEYHDALAWVSDADLEDPHTQHRLARLQVSGALEWSYSETPSQEAWYELAPAAYRQEPPSNLGAAGQT